MEYVNVRKRNSAKSYRETQPANMDTLVCLLSMGTFLFLCVDCSISCKLFRVVLQAKNLLI